MLNTDLNAVNGFSKRSSEGVLLETLCTVGGIRASALQRMSWHYNACTGQCMCACVCVCFCMHNNNHSYPKWPSIPHMEDAPRTVVLVSQYVTNNSWLIIICGWENITHNASVNCWDMNLVYSLKDNHADIRWCLLIGIHLNEKKHTHSFSTWVHLYAPPSLCALVSVCLMPK